MAIGQLSTLDSVRKSYNITRSRAERSQIGQFLTPTAIATFMASMFETDVEDVSILDPGAGAGVLFAACVETLLSSNKPPHSIEVVAYETDLNILPHLDATLMRCELLCNNQGIPFKGTICEEDFIYSAITEIEESLFIVPGKRFTHVILNPPYKKINSQTDISKKLYSSGMEVANLYAAFVWLSARMLHPKGQMVAITPRSFCNGPYFKKFRVEFLRLMSLNRIHLFLSRKKAFGDDNVLQENVIYYAARQEQKPKTVVISTSENISFNNINTLAIPYSDIVHTGDRDAFIHMGIDIAGLEVIKKMGCFLSSLSKLNLSISTGRTVDFRAREYLRDLPQPDTVPLIYPCHFQNSFIKWPLESGKKPNAIVASQETSDLLSENGYYVLTKRFSSKEQHRRVMAAIYDPNKIDAPYVSFENHLNFFHKEGKGLPERIAKGLALYLNSTLVDQYFRLFSGHTQVNATDLRKMSYPTWEQLIKLGSYVNDIMPGQDHIDEILEKECLTCA